MTEVHYPKHESPFREELADHDRRFEEAREEFLINYSYNTARAYWGDLEHLYDWCATRGFDILQLTERQFREYQALLRRRKYAESTIRRRRTAWQGLNAPRRPGRTWSSDDRQMTTKEVQ